MKFIFSGGDKPREGLPVTALDIDDEQVVGGRILERKPGGGDEHPAAGQAGADVAAGAADQPALVSAAGKGDDVLAKLFFSNGAIPSSRFGESSDNSIISGGEMAPHGAIG
jgi:hypothetical protein